MPRDWPDDAAGVTGEDTQAIRLEFWLLLCCWVLAAVFVVALLAL